MSILSATPISAAATERTAQEILYAFYQHFFSGAPVTLAGEQVTFPLLSPANYLFNQQQSNPAAVGAQIHTIFIDLRPTQVGNDAVTRLVQINTLLTIYVRVANPGAGLQSADFECRERADDLKRIFESGTQALAQLGMHNTKLRRGPLPMATPGLQTRMLIVGARLQYTSAY